MQNAGDLFFDLDGVLVVHGTELKMLPQSSIHLGNGTLIALGNLLFQNEGAFYADSGTVTFKGVTWENKQGSTFDPGISTVILDGNSSQNMIISSSANFTLNNLVVNTSGTLTITGSLTVTGNCDLSESSYINITSGGSLIVEGTFTGDAGSIGGAGETNLPVQLSSFTVAANRLNADLRWSTETEVNNYGFEIERRKISQIHTDTRGFESENDGVGSASVWSQIGFVQGSGTSSSPKQYSFADKLTTPGRYAYRLKQIDFDGTFAYYSASEIEIGIAPSELMLGSNYPNPFNPTTNIEFTIPQSGKTTLRVFNMIGQEVATLFEGTAEGGRIYQVTFSGSTLPSGLYFYRLEYGNQSTVKRMMLIK